MSPAHINSDTENIQEGVKETIHTEGKASELHRSLSLDTCISHTWSDSSTFVPTSSPIPFSLSPMASTSGSRPIVPHLSPIASNLIVNDDWGLKGPPHLYLLTHMEQDSAALSQRHTIARSWHPVQGRGEPSLHWYPIAATMNGHLLSSAFGEGRSSALSRRHTIPKSLHHPPPPGRLGPVADSHPALYRGRTAAEIHTPPLGVGEPVLSRRVPTVAFRAMETWEGRRQKKANFTCDICLQTFTVKHNLFSHRKAHAGIKGHVCPHCSREFTTQSVLARHMKTCKARTVQVC